MLSSAERAVLHLHSRTPKPSAQLLFRIKTKDHLIEIDYRDQVPHKLSWIYSSPIGNYLGKCLSLIYLNLGIQKNAKFFNLIILPMGLDSYDRGHRSRSSLPNPSSYTVFGICKNLAHRASLTSVCSFFIRLSKIQNKIFFLILQILPKYKTDLKSKSKSNFNQ